MIPRKKGIFIVFEGLDGSGKGTILSKISGYLFNSHKHFDNIVLTREPTHSGVGRTIRDMIAKSDSPKSDAKRLLSLYLEDRKEHLDHLIRPAVSTGAVVLCDRYKHSTLAYQQTQGISLQQIINLHKNMLVPDLTIILDVTPEIALERIERDRGEIEKFEEFDFLKELRENYLRLKTVLPDENIVIVDANQDLNVVFEAVKKEVAQVLEAKK